MIEAYEKIKKADMYGPDELLAHMMCSIQEKVKDVKSNEDFKDWSIDFIISICSLHNKKAKKLFGKGL
jgi:hypothetical protein|tara:strand:+ start:5777 stop:5980 length:204 start_codon:yes stop_codon:yes gene_type:complete